MQYIFFIYPKIVNNYILTEHKVQLKCSLFGYYRKYIGQLFKPFIDYNRLISGQCHHKTFISYSLPTNSSNLPADLSVGLSFVYLVSGYQSNRPSGSPLNRLSSHYLFQWLVDKLSLCYKCQVSLKYFQTSIVSVIRL